MLDNLQVIPEGAFTASGHIIEKVIDKISSVVGWSVTPKGAKAYQVEAEKYLVDKIKADSYMPELAKAVCISNVRKVIKEYQNQQNILSTALKFLNNTANPDSVDNDWLSYFFDNAKNISNEEMAIIWGQILAKEINMPSQIPKALIYILSVIDYEDAISFKKLANISIQIGESYYPIFFEGMSDKYAEIELSSSDIIRLVNTNLIQQNDMLFNVSLDAEDKITYFDEKIDVGNVTKICVGSVILSKAGQALMSVVTDKVKIDGFAKFVNNVVVKESGGIFDDIFGE